MLTLSQVSDEIRDAVLGNAGSLISFRIGPADAAKLSREFAERFSPFELLSLPNHHIYVRLIIDGAPSIPFSAATTAAGELGSETCKIWLPPC